MGEPREETPAFIREALADAITPLAPYPSAVGLPELRAAIAGWAGAPLRRHAGPGHRGDPDARLQGGRVRARATSSTATVVAVPTPAYPVYERGARVRRQARARAAAARGERLAAGPRRRRLVARRRCCGSTTRTTRPARPAPLEFYERAAALAREHGFVLASDEAYSELYFGGEPPASRAAGRRPLARRRLQHALQALVDARLPLRVRRRRPGDHRRAEEVPARTSASRRRSSSSARRSPPGATRRTSTRCASATGPSATRCCPRWRRSGCAARAATRRSSSGWTPAPTPTLAAALARGGRGRRARLVLRRGRRGLPAARAGPAAPRRARRAAEMRQSFACSAALRPGPAAGARQRLDRAGRRVAAEQQAVGAAELAALDDLAVGQRDQRARR